MFLCLTDSFEEDGFDLVFNPSSNKTMRKMDRRLKRKKKAQ